MLPNWVGFFAVVGNITKAVSKAGGPGPVFDVYDFNTFLLADDGGGVEAATRPSWLPRTLIGWIRTPFFWVNEFESELLQLWRIFAKPVLMDGADPDSTDGWGSSLLVFGVDSEIVSAGLDSAV